MGHELLHVSILASTLFGAGGLLLLVIWPLVAEAPLPAATRNALLGVVALGVILLIVEWRLVH